MSLFSDEKTISLTVDQLIDEDPLRQLKFEHVFKVTALKDL